MIRLSTLRCVRDRRLPGAVAVEFAVLLPVMMLFAAATTDFGRVIHHDLALSGATRAGAEYASLHVFTPATKSDWEENIRLAVLEELGDSASLATDLLEIEIATTMDSDSLNRTSVTTSMPFRTTVSWPWLPNLVNLSHRVEMRQTR